MSKKDSLASLDSVQDHNIGNGEYKLPVTPDTEYIVDDSCFVPMSEAVKQLGLNPNFTGSDQKTMYDFPDGKDNGIEMPINRTKDGKDIAELSSVIYEQQEKIGNEIKKEQEFEQYKQSISEKVAKQRAEASAGVQNSV